MAWRRAWAATWEQVKYCSDACRRRRPQPQDAQLEAAILALLAARARGASICPSEAVRAVFGGEGISPERMQRCRDAARRLVAQGQLEVAQRGRVVDAGHARGPIRLRLPAQR